MSDQTIALLALYICLLAIAGCLSFRTMQRKGYVVSDRSSPWWQRLFIAPCRPHAGTRLMVNALFWALLASVLLIASHYIEHIPFLSLKDSSPLGAKKFAEYADGELWALQLIAGIGVLAAAFLMLAFFRRVQLETWHAKEWLRFAVDDFWGVVLNFGSMFVVSGWLKAFEGKIQFLWTLALGFVNVVVYAFRPMFAFEREESTDASNASDSREG